VLFISRPILTACYVYFIIVSRVITAHKLTPYGRRTVAPRPSNSRESYNNTLCRLFVVCHVTYKFMYPIAYGEEGPPVSVLVLQL